MTAALSWGLRVVERQCRAWGWDRHPGAGRGPERLMVVDTLDFRLRGNDGRMSLRATARQSRRVRLQGWRVALRKCMVWRAKVMQLAASC